MNPIVGIDTGLLRGTITENSIGQPVYAFVGVPYARPPINDLRFKAPQPAESWSGIKNAVEYCPACSQYNIINNKTDGSEDCLCLNVFTKRLGSFLPLLPVMLFLYGGAFLMGSSTEYDPAFLTAEDIVFVSINYRVGVLGFLSLNDTSVGVPGNAGLKDQVLAMDWIKRNIKEFGGDPGKVTIFGQSAGAASVNYHIISPLSRGLFHGAIMESGSVLNPWAHLHPRSMEILEHLKISYLNDSQVLEELVKCPVQDLLTAEGDLYWSLPNSVFRLFAPTVEKPNVRAFLTRNPIDVITSGDFNKVPMIIGWNSNEGLYEYNTSVPTKPFIPPQTVLPDDEKIREKLIEKIDATYQIEKNINNKYLATGDSMFVAGAIGATLNFAETSSEPVYSYVFHFVGSRNFFRHILKLTNEIGGVCHGDELGYIFDFALFKDMPLISDSKEFVTVQRIVKLWANFAKFGNPTPFKDEFNITWNPVSSGTLFYLHLDDILSIKTNPWDRIELWGEIYKASNETKNFLP